MTTLNDIKLLTDKGFRIFPIQTEKKEPHISAFTEQATADFVKAKSMWHDPVLDIVQPYNIGIATTNFKDEGLLVVDVDVSDGKRGLDSLNLLELNGKEFPDTLTQITASGGLHLIYKTPVAVSQGAHVFGKGLDVRSRGGYIVGCGSRIKDKEYTFKNGNTPVAEAPAWMVEKCKEKEVEKKTAPEHVVPDTLISVRRASAYLRKAERSVQGEGGDETAFKVASVCKDLGTSQGKTLDLMLDLWNPHCLPPWAAEELVLKVENAYLYGKNDPGSYAPEADFEVAKDTDDPDAISVIEEYNDEFAYAIIGGKSTIIRDIPDKETSYLQVHTFHDLKKSDDIFYNGQWVKTSEAWMASPNRRTYSRVALLPNQDVPPDTYNLWKGFSCQPLTEEDEVTSQMKDGLAMFKEHAYENFCDRDDTTYAWFMAYFAQMIQTPEKKPTTAMVFKGEKGVGKNALIDRVGNLFAPHYLLTSNKRYLTSNFNNHLSQLLLFVLDEAFWSGDKQAEGVLKDLITGHSHLIEQKGKEMFVAKNLTRICIIGNEEWLAPATQDERRFAVFSVGNSRQQDTKFFRKMRKCIDEQGGNRLLLTYLMQYDLSEINLNVAPATEGLLNQKMESLSVIHSWWLQCLKDGDLPGSDFGAEWIWPASLSRDRVRSHFTEYAKERGVRSWLPNASVFGRELRKACPSIKDKRLGNRNERYWSYEVPCLKDARDQFEKFIGHQMKWETDPEVNVFS